MSYRDFVGASGAIYRYIAVDSEQSVPLGAGNFLYARVAADGRPTVIYAGEAERLATAILSGWREAVESHGATLLLARRNVSFSIREAEQADIVKANAPVMNVVAEEVSAG